MVLACCALLSCAGLAAAQEGPDRARILDSLAHPKVSETGRTMHFAEKVLDTGNIREDGGPREYRYSWLNAGDLPVSVVKVTATCGCTVPGFDRSPVAPGDSSSLTVTYYPKGHPGNFSRRIFVYTDLSGKFPAAILTLQGHVEPAAIPVWEYGYRMGSLVLKRNEVRFAEGRKEVARILCMNAGDKPMDLGAETMLLPPYIKVRFEPGHIAPGEKADIVISYDPGAAPMRMLDSVPVILTGPDVPPSRRTVKVLIT